MQDINDFILLIIKRQFLKFVADVIEYFIEREWLYLMCWVITTYSENSA